MLQQFRLRAVTGLCFGLTGLIASAADGDWTQWRGPAGDGHSTETNVPVEWDAKSIVWRTELPGDGQSSPVIAGDRIFLTSALERGRERLVFAVDRKKGKIVWKQIVWKGEPEPSHATNGWASASCATDGKHVVAFFGRGGIHCFDVNGKKLWSKNLGTFEGPWGTGASPILVDDMVIQNCEAEGEASLTAFDVRTGDVVWKTPRDIPEKGGWSTPVLVDTGSRRELVLNGFNGVSSYEPATGKKLWFCKSFAGRGEPTATPGNGLVFLINGLAGDIYAVEPGGSGDVTKSHMAWHTPRKAGRDQPSPIVVGDVLIVVSMDGIGIGYDTKSGRELWKERLGAKFTSSPIAAGGLAYFQSDAGETFVIKPGPKLDIVHRNTLPAAQDETFRASLAPSQGQMFSRSNKVLYCLTSSR
jgi:outer membrane protein assembly factor BamB